MNLKTTAAIATLATLAAVAGAEPVTMNFTGTGAGRSVRISHYGTDFGLFAGQLRHDITRADGHSDLLGDQVTYCVDLHEYVSSSDQDFWLTDLNWGDIPTAGNTYKAQRTQAVLNVVAAFGSDAYGDGMSNNSAAAFQLVLWEILTDFDPTAGLQSMELDTGDFQAYSNDTAINDGILSRFYLLRAAAMTQGAANAWVVHRDGGQDQLVIPAPGVIGLAGIGLGVATRRRRK